MLVVMCYFIFILFLNYTQIGIWRGGEKPPGSHKSGETIGFGWHLQVVSKNCYHRFVWIKIKSIKNEFAVLRADGFVWQPSLRLVLNFMELVFLLLWYHVFFILMCIFKHEICNENSFIRLKYGCTYFVRLLLCMNFFFRTLTEVWDTTLYRFFFRFNFYLLFYDIMYFQRVRKT